MKFALVNSNKVEATKGTKGLCPLCGSELTAKCGEVYINHWAHKGNRDCDPWWENETEWHRSWKNNFPLYWQEVVHKDNNSGEKHIADVKTENGWVLEFQHSLIKPEERRSRNAFYPKLIWVVDGTRRKTDIPQFDKILKENAVISNNPPLVIWRIHFPDECRLLKEWHNSDAIVFFDFQKADETKQTMLWLLFPKISDTEAYISTFPRNALIESLNENKFDEIVNNTIQPIHDALANNKQSKHKNTVHSRPSKKKVIKRLVPRHKNRRF